MIMIEWPRVSRYNINSCRSDVGASYGVNINQFKRIDVMPIVYLPEIVFQPLPTVYNFINLTGKKYERLLVIGYAGTDKNIKSHWYCECDCGRFCKVAAKSLVKQETRSCGCYFLEQLIKKNTKHGKSKDRVYWVWAGMINRCTSPHHQFYHRYGGRGIKVCDKWKDFAGFYADMGEPPTVKHSIDRIDSNGNYEPGNCRWILQHEQSRNLTTNFNIEYQGKTQPLVSWSEELGISYTVLQSRLRRYGWSVEKAFTTPVK